MVEISPGSVLEIVCQLSQVMWRITRVITSPMIGSASLSSSATTAALARTPSLTKPSTRACLPSATKAGLLQPPAGADAYLRGDFVADEADYAGGGKEP